jgi:hypothetical protein
LRTPYAQVAARVEANNLQYGRGIASFSNPSAGEYCFEVRKDIRDHSVVMLTPLESGATYSPVVAWNTVANCGPHSKPGLAWVFVRTYAVSDSGGAPANAVLVNDIDFVMMIN